MALKERQKMKTDKQGCSTCPPGQEQWEKFKSYIQYDYRTMSGELFSTIGPSLDECRRRRDIWIKSIVDPWCRL